MTTPSQAFEEQAIRVHFETLNDLAAGIDGQLILATYGEDPSTGTKIPPRVEHFDIRDVDGMVAAAMRWEPVPHANLYTPLCVLRRGLAPNKRGTKADVAAVLGFVVDQDADTGRTGKLPLPPSLVLETSPGNQQAFYFLKRSLTGDEADPIAVALRDATGADHGTSDCSHVWRIPGTLNWPNRKKVVERARSMTPFPVGVVSPFDGGLVDVEELRTVLADQAPRVQDLLHAAGGVRRPEGLELLIARGASEGEDRSATFYHAVGWAKDMGSTIDEIEAAMRAHPNGVAAKYLVGSDRLNAEIVRAFNKATVYRGSEGLQNDLSQAVEHPKDPEGTSNRKPNGSAPQAHDWRKSICTAAALQRMVFPPVSYVIPALLPEGLSLLAGRPKIGKSWLALDLCIAVAGDRICLGDHRPIVGDVLYAALEDNPRRLQRRIDKLLKTFSETWPDRLTLATNWRRLDKGGVDDLADWIASVVSPRLIVLDTLAGVKPIRTTSGYAEDYAALQTLHRLANDKAVAILVLHHTRKMEAEDPIDTVSGTLGLAGAADTVLVLTRSGRGQTLYVRGRDVEEAEHAVSFDRDACRWTILGNASEVHRSTERGGILAALEDGEATIADLVAATGQSRNNLDQLLYKMAKAGDIERIKRGTYALATPDKNGKTVRSGSETAEHSPSR